MIGVTTLGSSSSLKNQDFRISRKSSSLPFAINLPSSNQQYYQRSGTLVFKYLDDDYELRDGQYAKNSSDLRSVSTKNDLLKAFNARIF